MKQQKQKRLRCVLALALALAATGCGGSQASGSAQEAPAGSVAEPTPEPTPTPDPRIQFPCEVDGGKLTVNSLFQSSIFNPDCSDQSGEDIASLEIVNNSGEFLTSATFTAVLEDGATLNFVVEDLPAGRSVWAFETTNAVIASTDACVEITCETAYEPAPPLMDDRISVAADGTAVTLRNLTDEPLTGVTASFHCLFDKGLYFGGKTYIYPVDELPPGGETTLQIDECYLGTAEAVRVAQTN